AGARRARRAARRVVHRRTPLRGRGRRLRVQRAGDRLRRPARLRARRAGRFREADRKGERLGRDSNEDAPPQTRPLTPRKPEKKPEKTPLRREKPTPRAGRNGKSRWMATSRGGWQKRSSTVDTVEETASTASVMRVMNERAV